jgi:hypothetical protein
MDESKAVEESKEVIVVSYIWSVESFVTLVELVESCVTFVELVESSFS